MVYDILRRKVPESDAGSVPAPFTLPSRCSPEVGTADADIKVPSVENAEMTDVQPLRRGVGQNIATRALPTARNFFLVLISAFPAHSPSLLFQILWLSFNCVRFR